MNTYLESLIKNKKTCYFISPHFDDAIFSAGALMHYLSQYTNVVVITVFTKAGEKPYTLSAQKFLQQCGFSDANELFIEREKEDKHVLNRVAKQVINLGFIDALWRQKKKNILSRLFNQISEFTVLYPTYRFHIIKGKIVQQDFETVEDIKEKLTQIITVKNSVIFCPFSIGNHIDHVITRKACEEIFPKIIYWADFPYNQKMQKEEKGFTSFSFTKDLAIKKKLSEGYVTQYDAVFKEGYISKPEIYFVKK